MDNDNEHKMAYSDVINYSIQAMNENAQFSIAIAVRIFGVLAIVVILDSHNGFKPGDELTKKALDATSMDSDCRYSVIYCLLATCSIWNSESPCTSPA